jgi:cell division protein FtsX
MMVFARFARTAFREKTALHCAMVSVIAVTLYLVNVFWTNARALPKHQMQQ